jgi:pyruvate,water dikinase
MSDRYYVTDTALSERFPIYTRANVGEVFPDPVTPLTSDTALYLAELGWRDAWERMGAFDLDEFPPDDYCQLGVLGGYCYLNASLIRLFGERAPGLSWQMMDEQFFGAQPGIPPYEQMPGDVRPDMTEKIGATFIWVFGQQSLDDLTELTEDRAETKALRMNRPDLSRLSDEELWDRFREMLPIHRRMFAHHLFTTYMATVPVGVISAVAAAVARSDLIMPIISARRSTMSSTSSAAAGRTNGRAARRRGRPNRTWHWSQSTACAKHPTRLIQPCSSPYAPSSALQRLPSCCRWSRPTRPRTASSPLPSAARPRGFQAGNERRPTTSG